MAKRGAPPKISDTNNRAALTVEQFEAIAIEHAKAGKHWETLPAAIFKAHGAKVAKDAINGFLKNDEYKGAIKDLCCAISMDVLTEEMRRGDLPPPVWIFTVKNKFHWRDRIDTVSQVEINEEELKKLSDEELNKLNVKILSQIKAAE